VDTRHALQALIEEIPKVTDAAGALWTLLLAGPLGAAKAEQRVEELASAFARQWLNGMSDVFTNLAEQTAVELLAAVESAQQQILRSLGELPVPALASTSHFQTPGVGEGAGTGGSGSAPTWERCEDMSPGWIFHRQDPLVEAHPHRGGGVVNGLLVAALEGRLKAYRGTGRGDYEDARTLDRNGGLR
jgi:hypothetical protein